MCHLVCRMLKHIPVWQMSSQDQLSKISECLIDSLEVFWTSYASFKSCLELALKRIQLFYLLEDDKLWL